MGGLKFVTFECWKIYWKHYPTSKTRCESDLVAGEELLGHGVRGQGHGGGLHLDPGPGHLGHRSLGRHRGREVGDRGGGHAGQLTQASCAHHGLHPSGII